MTKLERATNKLVEVIARELGSGCDESYAMARKVAECIVETAQATIVNACCEEPLAATP